MSVQAPRLAVFKFASCDGCQLSFLSLEDELLGLASRLQIVYFLEATSRTEAGPYDVALIEGSITTAEDRERIQQVRRDSKYLVTIGACATSGGIQALRNWADSREFLSAVYATPEYIQTLSTSTAISDHVKVDFELRGCPINKHQLRDVLISLLQGCRPQTAQHCVCLDCKRRGTVCVMVAQNIPCLGPVTHTGCGALCPSYDRGCYGCYGPAAQPNLVSLTSWFEKQGVERQDIVDQLRDSFNGYAPEFRAESNRLEQAP
jgi:coenzyme F420-reducing hydrogenase gamma subunit